MTAWNVFDPFIFREVSAGFNEHCQILAGCVINVCTPLQVKIQNAFVIAASYTVGLIKKKV